MDSWYVELLTEEAVWCQERKQGELILQLREQFGMIDGIRMWEAATLSGLGSTSLREQDEFFTTFRAVL